MRSRNMPTSMKLTRIGVMVAVAACTATASAQSDTRYRVAPLPRPNGVGYVSALGLNNSNQVTGGAFIDGQTRPFIIADGQFTVLNQVPGVQTSAWAVNDKGHVTGWMYEWGVIWPQAFLWDGQQNHWLIDPHDSHSYAQGLNNRDQVVGFYYPPGGHPNGNAFVVTDGEYYNLGGGQATDISAGGIVVGQSNRYFGATAVWTPNGQGGWSLTPLDGMLATAINEQGTMVVGAGPLVSYLDTAVLWTRQGQSWVRTDIGDWDPNTTSTISTDVNNAGQVVGNYESFVDNDRGWLYANGQVTWLTDRLAPESGDWDVVAASRVNESGVILAEAIRQGESSAAPVLLIPDSVTILGPRGDGAGASNELIAVSAEPGHRVHFIYGFSTGQRSIPGCPGVFAGVSGPQIIGSAVADANSEARLRLFIPRAASGRTIYLQAIDATGCEVSNVLRYTFR